MIDTKTDPTRRNFLGVAGMAGSAIALPAFMTMTGCGSATLHTILTVVDAALAATDAFLAGFGSAIPAPYSTYVTTALDALNFLATELQQNPPLTIAQIAKDALQKLGPLVLNDLTGLNPQQVKLYQALAAAILAVLNEVQAAAAPAGVAPAIATKKPGVVALGWTDRMAVNSRIHKIAVIRAKVK